MLKEKETPTSNLSQKQVWNGIAVPWKKFRAKPVKEAIEFLKRKKGKILDLGCGNGRNFLKQDNLEIYAVDFSENMLNFAKEYAKKEKINAKFFLVDLEKKLPFNDNFFDAAIFIASLHCIESEKKRKQTLKELYRVLKPKAQAMITAWDKNQPRFRKAKKEIYLAWKENDKRYMRYYYLYEKDELVNLLKSVGFKIKKIFEHTENKSSYSDKNIIVVVEK